MAVVNDVTQLSGLFKNVYAEKIITLIPDFAVLQKEISFSGTETKLGAEFDVMVALTSEGGFTYMGDADSVGVNTDLNAAVAGLSTQAKVKPSSLLLRSQISFTAMSRSQGDEGSFRRATGFKVEDMNKSARKRIELAMLYGQTGLGILGAVSGAGPYTLTFSDDSWAPGIWAGSEGHLLDVFNAALSTKRNSTSMVITSVNTDAKQIVITGTAAGIAATDRVFFYNSVVENATPALVVHREAAGIDRIMTNTGSLFNIDAGTYTLWRSNLVTTVGPLTFSKVQDAVAKAVNKGLMEGVTLLLSPRAWAALNSNEAALRQYDVSYKPAKGERGNEALVFHSANGKIEIKAHPFVKEGEAFLLPLDSVRRVGSSDLTFGAPNMQDQFVTMVPNRAAYEFQCYSDQAVFIDSPAFCVKLSGITY